jgi:hypothetical protein
MSIATPATAESLSAYNSRRAEGIVDRLNAVSGRLSDALVRSRGPVNDSKGTDEQRPRPDGSLYVTREYLNEADEVITEIHAKLDALESLI